MKALIHFTVKDTEDSIVLFGETAEEIRTKIEAELLKRSGDYISSLILEE